MHRIQCRRNAAKMNLSMRTPNVVHLRNWFCDTTSGWHTYIVILTIWVGGWECGLTAFNRILLSTGVYRFPYPLTITLFQQLFTCLVVWATAVLFRNLSNTCIPQTLDPPQVAVQPNTARKCPRESTEWLSWDLLKYSGDIVDYFNLSIIRQVFPVVVVYTANMTLSTWSFSHGQLPSYLLARIGLMPFNFIFTVVVDQQLPSLRIILYSLLASLCLSIAIMFQVIDIYWSTFVAGLFSSVFAALYPILLFQNFNQLACKVDSQRYHHTNLLTGSTEHKKSNMHSHIVAFWSTLGYISTISLGLLLVIVALSGELSHISRNCYILDVKTFWGILLGSSFATSIIFIFTLLLVTATSSTTTTFSSVPNSAFQLIVLSKSKINFGCWVASWITWLFSIQYFAVKRTKNVMNISNKQGASLVFPKVLIAVALCSCMIYAFQQHARIIGSPQPTKFSISNAHANWINRPANTVVVKDDYLGTRPHTDTVADLPLLEKSCRSFYSATETDHDGLQCLSYLANAEAQYYMLPEEGHGLRASDKDPTKADYTDADGHGNTQKRYPTPLSAAASSKNGTGTCAGPIIPYHTYWVGPASWRVELFIKSYFYTQNLPCSRIWLWLDVDRNRHAVRDMCKDPAFKLFLPLIERGDIVLREWKYPTRIPLPMNLSSFDRTGRYKFSRGSNLNRTLIVADEVVQDTDGQHWLNYNPRYRPYLNDYMSDTARFTILLLHGGLWCDMDIVLLRDMRPLALPHPVHGKLAFGEQWVERSHIADYNSAVVSAAANSSFSSFLLQGGVRMGMNFCPKVLGRMTWKEGRLEEFPMLDTAAFDPSTCTINLIPGRKCSVPCHTDYKDVFMGRLGAVKDEWRSFDGTQLQTTAASDNKTIIPNSLEVERMTGMPEYVIEKDLYPPNNRTLQNFFRGAWGYHIHNQWSSHPEPSSWLDVIIRAQDGFFAGLRTNPYGEKWDGPELELYPRWPEFS